MIRAYLFDLEGTLIDGALAHERAADEVYGILARFRPKLTKEQFQRQFAGSLRMNVRGRGGAPASPQAVYAERFKRTLTWLGEEDDNLARRLGRLYASLLLDRSAAYPDATAALPVLARQATIAVVANGSEAALRRQIESAGLARYVTAVFGSQEVGHAKPEPELVSHALEALEIPPAEALVVGDASETDIAAARAAGVAAAWVNRAGRKWPEGVARPVRIISALTELL